MRLEELNRLISEPGFWDDSDKANTTMAEISSLKNGVEGFDELQGLYDDIGALIEMAEEENDDSMISEIGDELEKKCIYLCSFFIMLAVMFWFVEISDIVKFPYLANSHHSML